mgnify:CR=1 FL=1
MEVFPGNDQLTRVVKIWTEGKMKIRAIANICPLKVQGLDGDDSEGVIVDQLGQGGEDGRKETGL